MKYGCLFRKRAGCPCLQVSEAASGAGTADHVGRKKGPSGIKHPQERKRPGGGEGGRGHLSWMHRLERLIRGSMGNVHMFSGKMGLAGEGRGRLE